jgi:hypothetical protein
VSSSLTVGTSIVFSVAQAMLVKDLDATAVKRVS